MWSGSVSTFTRWHATGVALSAGIPEARQEHEPGKRIVSKAEYIAAAGKKVVYSLGVVGLPVITAACIVGVIIGTIIWLTQLHSPASGIDVIALIIALGCMAYWSKKAADKSLAKAVQPLQILPLTRANAADLPVSESLVRSSEEPLQAQQAILLRAASETGEGQEDELLRASAERE